MPCSSSIKYNPNPSEKNKMTKYKAAKAKMILIKRWVLYDADRKNAFHSNCSKRIKIGKLIFN